MNKVNVKLMTTLIQNNQRYTKKLLSHFLRNYYEEGSVFETKDYLYAIGDIPIALVAHMDTVFEANIPAERQVLYDKSKGIMFCPQGGGFDDKAGIYAILQIVKSGLRPHVIFTTDEETGALGASALAIKTCPFKDLRYIIQLDRRNVDDCVFYDCDNPEFVKYVEEFGFVEHFGTFSDISVLCPAWGVAGVNLSVGYEHEHTRYEILYVRALNETIKKVKAMLSIEEIPSFKYIPLAYTFAPGYTSKDICRCAKCQHYFFPEEVFPTVSVTGATVYYCPDCIAESKIGWCSECGHPFEALSLKDEYHCVICEEKLKCQCEPKN
jgi:hypothetical protein